MASSTHRILKALIARILCLIHISFSIYVLWHVKRDLLYMIPIVGAICLLAETAIIITIFAGKEPTRWFSSAFCIYVITIVVVYWFLELENIIKLLSGLMIRDYKITLQDLRGDIVSLIKIVWSQLELQIFFVLIILIRWLIPKSRNMSHHGLSDLLFKYFAISCDMLDFLTILRDTWLIRNPHIVYWTLSAWSLSTIQFFVFVPDFDDDEVDVFTAHISNSLLSALLQDVPYLGIRLAAIFGFGSHNYNSYFFATKNVVMILLQLFRVKSSFSDRQAREDKNARKLRDRVGFDKEANKLFDANEVAKRNFMAQQARKAAAANNYNNNNNNKKTNNNSIDGLDDITNFNNNRRKDSFDSLDNEVATSPPTRVPRLPRSIESIKTNKQSNNNAHNSGSENTYLNSNMLNEHTRQQHQPAANRRSERQQQNRQNRQQKSSPSEQKLNFIKSQLARPTEFMPEEYVAPAPSMQDNVRSNLYSQNYVASPPPKSPGLSYPINYSNNRRN